MIQKKPAPPKHDMTGYGIPDGPPQQFAMLVYPQMTVLDLVGPLQMFHALGNVRVDLVWKERNLVTSNAGIAIQPTTTPRREENSGGAYLPVIALNRQDSLSQR
jgi:transcriptional regulator GlxA family with amidase domain